MTLTRKALKEEATMVGVFYGKGPMMERGHTHQDLHGKEVDNGPTALRYNYLKKKCKQSEKWNRTGEDK